MDTKIDELKHHIQILAEESSDFRDVDFLVKLCKRYALSQEGSQLGSMLYFISELLEHNKDNITFKE